ncbi:hypothetical protein L1049_012844 [Liquidambar formosana]|uniref:Late embryogenesis abundant protein LEA-2 subgroup domain-containing protein n=1 Tax=Liquidambar formosana TaxID=63359 RepID=A0AAP0RL39_LIQFO
MAEPVKPVLQKPPGYRDPNVPVQPAPRPPVRKPALPPSFQPKKKRRSCCRIFCCSLCILTFILLLILAVSIGIFYIWFDPKLPVFHLQSFKVERFNVSVTSDGTFLDSRTVVRVEVKNPNSKLTVYYGGTRVKVTVGEDDTELGNSEFEGVHSGEEEHDEFEVHDSGEE